MTTPAKDALVLVIIVGENKIDSSRKEGGAKIHHLTEMYGALLSAGSKADAIGFCPPNYKRGYPLSTYGIPLRFALCDEGPDVSESGVRVVDLTYDGDIMVEFSKLRTGGVLQFQYEFMRIVCINHSHVDVHPGRPDMRYFYLGGTKVPMMDLGMRASIWGHTFCVRRVEIDLQTCLIEKDIENILLGVKQARGPPTIVTGATSPGEYRTKLCKKVSHRRLFSAEELAKIPQDDRLSWAVLNRYVLCATLVRRNDDEHGGVMTYEEMEERAGRLQRLVLKAHLERLEASRAGLERQRAALEREEASKVAMQRLHEIDAQIVAVDKKHAEYSEPPVMTMMATDDDLRNARVQDCNGGWARGAYAGLMDGDGDQEDEDFSADEEPDAGDARLADAAAAAAAPFNREVEGESAREENASDLGCCRAIMSGLDTICRRRWHMKGKDAIVIGCGDGRTDNSAEVWAAVSHRWGAPRYGIPEMIWMIEGFGRLALIFEESIDAIFHGEAAAD
jgi:hypothetical protein